MKNVSFRYLMRGEIDELLQNVGLQGEVSASWVAATASRLATLREEGLSLWPEVYFSKDVQKLAAVLQGTEIIRLGSGPAADETVMKAIKDCAPLATSGWVIFVESSGGKLDYGVLSPTNLPLAITPYEALVEQPDPTNPCLVIRRIAESCVEIRGAGGNGICLYLSDQRSETPTPDEAISAFCHAATRTIPEAERSDAYRYFYRTLSALLVESHGTLLAVQSGGHRKKLLKQFADSVVLPAAVSIPGRVMDYRQHKDEEAVVKIASATTLLRGMLNSDGIIVFRSDGSIIAYRAFLKVSPKTRSSPPGGARRRAFESLKALVGHGLDAVLMRSQDGQTEFFGRDSN